MAKTEIYGKMNLTLDEKTILLQLLIREARCTADSKIFDVCQSIIDKVKES